MFNNPSYIVIGISFLVGVILRQTRKLPDNAHATLNGFVIHLALPALILFQVPSFFRAQSLTTTALLTALMPWFGFLLAWGLSHLAARVFSFTREARISMTIALGLGNTAFVGFPILESLLGPQALPYGIIIDQLGTFLVLTVVGVSYLAFQVELGEGRGKAVPENAVWSKSFIAVFKRMFQFTPFLALLGSIVLIRFSLPDAFEQGLGRLAGCLVPAALVSVGYQARFQGSVFRKWKKELAVGLVLKLIFWPAFFGAIYLGFMDRGMIEYQVLVLQAAMAPMITSLLLAMEAGFAVELCALYLSVGIPLSFLTTWLWSKVLI